MMIERKLKIFRKREKMMTAEEKENLERDNRQNEFLQKIIKLIRQNESDMAMIEICDVVHYLSENFCQILDIDI